MKRYPILEVCARVEGHSVQQQMLREYCKNFNDWQGLLERAEREGMAPLLRQHLLESGVDIPASVQRSLNILYKRHQKQAEVRLQVLQVLQVFQQHQLTPILIKGAALSQTLYTDPALRPMRDIDLLFSEVEVVQAQEILISIGFIQPSTLVPLDHYHLPPLHKKVEGSSICIELHQGLYPNCPPYYPNVNFKELFDSGMDVDIGDTKVKTLNHVETLHYMYQHGLHAPLTYETYKLINAADITGYVERYSQEIDWLEIKERFPKVYRALPLMQYISPWNPERVSSNLIPSNRSSKLLPIPFHGWPQRRMKELEKKVTRKELLGETFLPSRWWLGVYYGAGSSTMRLIKALMLDHPRNVLWWTHVYSHFVIRTDPASVNPDNSFIGSMRLFVVSAWNKTRGVIRKLFSL